MSDPTVHKFRAALAAGIDELVLRKEGRPRELWRAALRLEHVILSDILTPEEEADVLEGMDVARVRACRDIFCRLETTIERSFAELVAGGHAGVVLQGESITENYLVRYERLARGEAALAGITSRDHALFIGSGPFPITAIEYCRQTGCSADCVDFVPEAVEISRAVVERLGLHDRMRCCEARGEHFSASEYSVVLVGVLAQPKGEIFQNLDATCPHGCRIIARTTFGLRSLVYPPAAFERDWARSLGPAGKSEAKGDQVISALLYVKA